VPGGPPSSVTRPGQSGPSNTPSSGCDRVGCRCRRRRGRPGSGELEKDCDRRARHPRRARRTGRNLLATVHLVAANIEPYVRVDGTKVWSVMQLANAAPRPMGGSWAATSPVAASEPRTPERYEQRLIISFSLVHASRTHLRALRRTARPHVSVALHPRRTPHPSRNLTVVRAKSRVVRGWAAALGGGRWSPASNSG